LVLWLNVVLTVILAGFGRESKRSRSISSLIEVRRLLHFQKIFRWIKSRRCSAARKAALDKSDCTDYNGCMDRLPTPLEFLTNRRTLAWLLVPVMFFPIGIAILFLFARIFALLNDTFSASILDGTALVLGILWCLSLILLSIVTALLVLYEESEQ